MESELLCRLCHEPIQFQKPISIERTAVAYARHFCSFSCMRVWDEIYPKEAA